VLRLQFTAPEKALPTVFEAGGLRLPSELELRHRLDALVWFSRYCGRRAIAQPWRQERSRPATRPVAPVGFGPDEHVAVAWLCAPAFRLLQEYYTLPAKFLFVDVKGFDKA